MLPSSLDFSFTLPSNLLKAMVASNYLTALEIRALLAEGQTTIDRILKDHRLGYGKRDGQVNTWVCVDRSKASRVQNGALSGIVIGIKDSISTSSATPLSH
jgi:Asp-tRNA(Asn)/Glu-tRNA(Gln) amidotransferase A subunit family amidase